MYGIRPLSYHVISFELGQRNNGLTEGLRSFQPALYTKLNKKIKLFFLMHNEFLLCMCM